MTVTRPALRTAATGPSTLSTNPTGMTATGPALRSTAARLDDGLWSTAHRSRSRSRSRQLELPPPRGGQPPVPVCQDGLVAAQTATDAAAGSGPVPIVMKIMWIYETMMYVGLSEVLLATCKLCMNSVSVDFHCYSGQMQHITNTWQTMTICFCCKWCFNACYSWSCSCS